jgi:hypothetical protein
MREIAVENLKCVSIKAAKKNIEFSLHFFFIKERLKTFQLFIFPSIFNPLRFLLLTSHSTDALEKSLHQENYKIDTYVESKTLPPVHQKFCVRLKR